VLKQLEKGGINVKQEMLFKMKIIEDGVIEFNLQTGGYPVKDKGNKLFFQIKSSSHCSSYHLLDHLKSYCL
jgi:hypothetical protein